MRTDRNASIDMNTNIYTNTGMSKQNQLMCISICMCTCICMCIRIRHLYMEMYTCICVCICICMRMYHPRARQPWEESAPEGAAAASPVSSRPERPAPLGRQRREGAYKGLLLESQGYVK